MDPNFWNYSYVSINSLLPRSLRRCRFLKQLDSFRPTVRESFLMRTRHPRGAPLSRVTIGIIGFIGVKQRLYRGYIGVLWGE